MPNTQIVIFPSKVKTYKFAKTGLSTTPKFGSCLAPKNWHLATRMWANAERDGRPAEYWWRLVFNAAKFG